MHSVSSLWCRVFAVVAAVAALAVLFGGLPAAAGTPGDRTPGDGSADGRVTSAPVGVAVVQPGDGQGPGCDDGAGNDGGLTPATPPRGSSTYELLPAPQTVPNGVSGCWAVAGAVPGVVPERGPPPVAAPSPIDLSVLRV
ncbi:hypothetical protein [Streptomyces sp. FIT100]|uniref:hypothetical protein n=1 Tax=Streptomyces sp. FIT100 TaxID=2837956 RepID=UPI0021C8B8AE|nr:hypothetical protein [Streptomyces sp. FIT100]UUN27803.1 hypothetical protein KK483_16410 [Streptomyces sp. FIT100]